MRKVCSMLLLVVFGFLLVSPLLAMAPDANSKLMACCRRDGKHHCASAMTEVPDSAERGSRLTAPPERCPYCPAGAVNAYHGLSEIAQQQTVFPLLLTRPAGVVQTESRLRISHNRSRQKRGPPAIRLS